MVTLGGWCWRACSTVANMLLICWLPRRFVHGQIENVWWPLWLQWTVLQPACGVAHTLLSNWCWNYYCYEYDTDMLYEVAAVLGFDGNCWCRRQTGMPTKVAHEMIEHILHIWMHMGCDKALKLRTWMGVEVGSTILGRGCTCLRLCPVYECVQQLVVLPVKLYIPTHIIAHLQIPIHTSIDFTHL